MNPYCVCVCVSVCVCVVAVGLGVYATISKVAHHSVCSAELAQVNRSNQEFTPPCILQALLYIYGYTTLYLQALLLCLWLHHLVSPGTLCGVVCQQS